MYTTTTSGSAGKSLINEMTRLTAGVSPIDNFAIKAVSIMSSLLLQIPSYESGSKQHNKCLVRQLKSWKNADFKALVNEACVIHGKLQSAQNLQTDDSEKVRKIFAKLMLQDKVLSSNFWTG